MLSRLGNLACQKEADPVAHHAIVVSGESREARHERLEKEAAANVADDDEEDCAIKQSRMHLNANLR